MATTRNTKGNTMNRKPFHSVVDPDNPLIVWASHQEMRRAKAKAAKAKAGK